MCGYQPAVAVGQAHEMERRGFHRRVTRGDDETHWAAPVERIKMQLRELKGIQPRHVGQPGIHSGILGIHLRQLTGTRDALITKSTCACSPYRIRTGDLSLERAAS